MHGQLLVGSVDVAGVDHRVALVLLPEDLPDAPDPFGSGHRAKGTAGSSRSHQRRLGHLTTPGRLQYFEDLAPGRAGGRCLTDISVRPAPARGRSDGSGALRTDISNARRPKSIPRRQTREISNGEQGVARHATKVAWTGAQSRWVASGATQSAGTGTLSKLVLPGATAGALPRQAAAVAEP